jgi:hypothetical protein
MMLERGAIIREEDMREAWRDHCYCSHASTPWETLSANVVRPGFSFVMFARETKLVLRKRLTR